MLPFVGELLAGHNGLKREIMIGGQVREQEKHRDSIIKVAQCISECRVPLFHNVVELDLWLIVLLEAFGVRVVTAAKRFRKFFGEGFVFAEFLEDRLMEKVLYVLCL